jgi:hypothetical protein
VPIEEEEEEKEKEEEEEEEEDYFLLAVLCSLIRLCSCYFLALFVGSKAYYTVIYFSCKI